jgi:hypothetical protein
MMFICHCRFRSILCGVAADEGWCWLQALEPVGLQHGKVSELLVSGDSEHLDSPACRVGISNCVTMDGQC